MGHLTLCSLRTKRTEGRERVSFRRKSGGERQEDDNRTADKGERERAQKKRRATRVHVTEAQQSVKFSKVDGPHLTVKVNNKGGS